MTIKYYSPSRALEIKSSDGTYIKQAPTSASGSESDPDIVTLDIPKADTYYIYSTNSGIRITDITITYKGENILIGDTDLNGTIDKRDAAFLLRHISSLSALTDERQLIAGECNGDSLHTIADVIAILRYINN